MYIMGILSSIFLGFVIGVSSVMDGTFSHHQKTSVPYKHGQIDAQTGKIYWHLVKQPDGSVQWEYRKSLTTKE